MAPNKTTNPGDLAERIEEVFKQHDRFGLVDLPPTTTLAVVGDAIARFKGRHHGVYPILFEQGGALRIRFLF